MAAPSAYHHIIIIGKVRLMCIRIISVSVIIVANNGQ